VACSIVSSRLNYCNSLTICWYVYLELRITTVCTKQTGACCTTSRQVRPYFVSDSFSCLIWSRQYAWSHKRLEKFWPYHNRVQRAVLCQWSWYYNRRVWGLCQCNPRSGGKKWSVSQVSQHIYVMVTWVVWLIILISSCGVCQMIWNNITVFMQSVSNDLKQY